MFEALDLSDRVTLITGGAGRIGEATARLMAGRGARVAIADIRYDSAGTLAREIGDAAFAVEVDLASESSIIAAVDRVVRHFGRLDILVNNAMAADANLHAGDGRVGEMTAEVWNRTFAVNCTGAMIMSREAMPHLISARGCIVNTASALGLQGTVRQNAYSTSKAALVQMTRNIATGYGRSGVRCNAVAPGLILTPSMQFPADWRRLIEAETPRECVGAPADIAEAIAFLASDAARNITGHTLVADGGASIHIPGLEGYLEATA